MATAFTAWLRAPAPTTCTWATPWWRMAPATAPATAVGLEPVETRRISFCEDCDVTVMA